MRTPSRHIPTAAASIAAVFALLSTVALTSAPANSNFTDTVANTGNSFTASIPQQFGPTLALLHDGDPNSGRPTTTPEPFANDTDGLPATTGDWDGSGRPGKEGPVIWQSDPVDEAVALNGNIEPSIYFFRQNPGNYQFTITVEKVDTLGNVILLGTEESQGGGTGQTGVSIVTVPIAVNDTLQPGERLRLTAEANRDHDVLYGSNEHPSTITLPTS